MTFISAGEAADKWGISKRRVQVLCSEQRIPGAVRIGNMWVVPENAPKPSDARKKDTVTAVCDSINPIRAARSSLKTLSASAYEIAKAEYPLAADAKKSVMAVFAAAMLVYVTDASETESAALSGRICDLFSLNGHLSVTASSRVGHMFVQFLREHAFCSDDALSWAYQFVNKLSRDTGLESTQFFTEKYMITSLVDPCMIESKTDKILDPACGGGNFLLYALDYLCDAARLPKETALPEYIRLQLKRLYGYELDPVLAAVASINLRIKALAILKEHGFQVSPEDFYRYIPNIYYSSDRNIEGALDKQPERHIVVQAAAGLRETLAGILHAPEFIFTNPPFKTVKGMGEDLKVFLKLNYPNVKCDMCNAFIELSLGILAEGGICGMVTQNSWIYLDSFQRLRESLLKRYSIKSVIELGSNAFYDLSGEKANVVLLSAQKTRPNAETSIAAYSLKHLSQGETERLLSSGNGVDGHSVFLNQLDILGRPGVRLGISSTDRALVLQNSCPAYGEYAVPMQGTSTGDSKSLVGYFWEHIGDADWRPVSKGGGYSRWLGLNSYSVKWGKDGEFIKDTPGSALRNVKYFDQTQLVFSDTGMAGLNVRLLREGQIFIASGPGIRVTQGDYLSHIAFLNSRFASYFIRLLSPKLTIAAGYIAKIPVLDSLLSSEVLAEYARICIDLKRDRLSKRPIYLEFEPLTDGGEPTALETEAERWFLKDLEDEWRQVCAENEIDFLLLDAFELTDSDRENLNAQVGRHALDIGGNKLLSVDELDRSISELLSANCMLGRTRPDKNNLGCDGVLEYLAHKIAVSPNKLYPFILNNAHKFQKTHAKYMDAYIHSLVLSALGYAAHTLPAELSTKELLEEVAQRFPGLTNEIDSIGMWIESRLTSFHKVAFLDTPLIHYSVERNAVELLRGEA